MERPRDYKPDIAVLLGPTQPNPAVVASVASTSTARPVANGDACSSQTGDSNFVAAVRSAAQLAALPGRASASGGAPSGAPSATAAAAGSAAAGGLGPASSKGGPRDLSLPADQSKQDEVFIGGLPSNWKAQQVYMQLTHACRLGGGGRLHVVIAHSALVATLYGSCCRPSSCQPNNCMFGH